jgi:hypothetical protein
MIQTTQQRKKPFSSFTYREAFKHLGVTELKHWVMEAQPVPISNFFRQRLERLQRFDLESLEVSKTFIDRCLCEEGLEEFNRLKVWKGAYLEGDDVCGNADYLIAERRASPFV